MTAVCASSADNLQPWHFVFLSGTKAKSLLSKALSGKLRQDMFANDKPETEIQARVMQTVHRTCEAPVIIILCRDRTKIKHHPDSARQQAEALKGTQSVALAGLQFLLAAHAEGLACTWICWPLFALVETGRALRLTSDWESQGMVFLVYPAQIPEMSTRLSLQEVTHFL